MLLVLHGAQEDGVGQVDHLRHAAALRAEENPLTFRRAVDDVFRRAEIFADECRFVLVEGALEVRREEAVHHVHARSQTELGDAAQDQRLVGGLLRVLAEHDDPARIERAVHVVVAAVHVQRVLGERARRRPPAPSSNIARRVVVLLDAVHDTLSRRVVDDALAAHRVRDGAALRGVFALGFDGDRCCGRKH